MKSPVSFRAFNDSWHDHEKLRYAGVGVWNTVFAYLAFAFVYGLLHDRIHYLIISFAAHSLAVCNAFICQRWLVFPSKSPWLKSFIRFNVGQLLVAGTGILGISFLVEICNIRPLWAQLAMMTIAVVVSYFMSKYFAFKG